MYQKISAPTRALLALGFAAAAAASENYDLRYAPGTGGADMSAPFESGFAVQLPFYRYSGDIHHEQDSQVDLSKLGAPAGAMANVSVRDKISLDVTGVLARFNYLSNKKFLGGQIGFTVMLPLLRKKTTVNVEQVDVTAPNAALAAAVRGGAGAAAGRIAGANSNARTGVGDLEVAPLLRWGDDNSQWLFVPALVLPTGSYDENLAANPGSGNFYTFRPLVQYSYIGNGWDIGLRGSMAFNTENKDTHFRTGNYADADLSVMKSVSDALRLGVAGYALVQTTADSRSETPTDEALLARQGLTVGDKGSVYGLGLQFAYLKGGGDFLLDGRVLKEFDTDNRPKGTTAIMNLSVPF